MRDKQSFSTTLLDSALSYASHSLSVFPCRNKRPLTRHGFHDASTDSDQIKRWWRKYQDAQIGIATGKSGLVIVDLDDRDGKWGTEEWDELTEKHGRIETLEVVTGGGGRHLYLWGSTRSVNGVRPGLDIKSQGGYVIAPPSLHESGQCYEWDGAEFRVEDIKKAPPWVLELSRPSLPSSSQIINRLSPDKVQEIRSALSFIDSDNYDRWIEIGMALKSTGAGLQARGLWDEWSKQSPKYRPHEIGRKWASFDDYGAISLSTLFHHAKGNGWIEREEEIEIVEEKEEKRENVSYEPLEGVLKDVYEWALKTAPVPQEGLALSAGLALGSFLMGRKYVAEPGVELNLYMLNIGESGAGKDHPRNIIKKAAYEGGWSEQIGEDVFSGSAVYAAMAPTNKRLYLLDEFGLTLQRGLNSQNGNHVSLIKALLSIYTSSASTVSGADYASKDIETVTLYRPCLVLLGSTTPKMFYEALTSGDADNGFLPRILAFSAGKRKMPRDVAFSEPPYSLMRWMEKIRDGEEKSLVDMRPTMIRMTKEAKRLFDEFSAFAFEQQRGEKGDLVWSRAAVMLKKVAAIAAGMGPLSELTPLIESEIMKWSIRIVKDRVRWLERTIKGNVADSEYQRMRQEVLRVFEGDGLTDRDVRRGKGMSHIRPRDRMEIIEDLKKSGEIQRVKTGEKRARWKVSHS